MSFEVKEEEEEEEEHLQLVEAAVIFDIFTRNCERKVAMMRSKAAVILHTLTRIPSFSFFHASGNLLHLPCNFQFPYCQLLLRDYSKYARGFDDDNNDAKMFLKSMRQQCKLGFSKIDDSLSLFNQMKSMRPLPSIIDFNQLFSAMCKIKPHPPFATVISLLRHIESSGIPPNHYSLSILVNCYCRSCRVDFGFSILAKVFKLGHQPNIVIFNTLINGLIHSDQLGEAVG